MTTVDRSGRTRGIKAKGRDAETAIVDLLRRSGWPYAERRRLTGVLDRGDIAGTPSICWEAKSGSRITLPEWLRETETERVNDKAAYGVLVIKPKGIGDTRVAEWPAVLPLAALLRLLTEAGYGTPIAEPAPALDVNGATDSRAASHHPQQTEGAST